MYTNSTMTISKILRFISNSKYRGQGIGVIYVDTKVINYCRYFHSVSKLCFKMYIEHENNYAYNIMKNKGYAMKLDLKEVRPLPKQSLHDLLHQSWQTETPNIFEKFSFISELSSKQKLCISEKMFDDFIDILTDNLKKASDTELKSVFYSLSKWPEVESITIRNYIEVWVALDDECLKRVEDWSYDEMLNIISLFYMLNIVRVSDFSNKCLSKLATKAIFLTPAQLVKTMFFIGVQRKSPNDIHQLEVCINNYFKHFTIDELAIISMGFFKTKTPIRNLNLVLSMIKKIEESCSQIHEISLAALLKVIRYSLKSISSDGVYSLLDKLQYEVPRLSVLCNVHIALVATSTLTFHEGCLNAILERVRVSLSETRMKDLERLALTFGTFNYKPLCGGEDIFLKITEELKKQERGTERDLHGRSFACCVTYLGLLGIYDKDLIKMVFNPVFLEKTYGKHCSAYGREILSLYNTVKIFCKGSSLSQLSDKQVNILVNKYTDHVPNENYKKQFNFTERLFLDVLNILREARGAHCVKGRHILTHHQRADIILCNDNKGNAVPIEHIYDSRYFGVMKSPPDDNKWIVLIIGGRNALIRNVKTPTGQFKSKINQLRALGFYPALVTLEEISKCTTKEAKLEYVNYLINQALKSK